LNTNKRGSSRQTTAPTRHGRLTRKEQFELPQSNWYTAEELLKAPSIPYSDLVSVADWLFPKFSDAEAIEPPAAQTDLQAIEVEIDHGGRIQR